MKKILSDFVSLLIGPPEKESHKWSSIALVIFGIIFISTLLLLIKL